MYDDLVDALQVVSGAARTLASIDRGPSGTGNLSDIGPDERALVNLRDFWQAHDTAQRLLDTIPAPALDDLRELTGKPWKLAARRALDALADSIKATRPWWDDNPDTAIQEAGRREAVGELWLAIFNDWPYPHAAELAELTAALRTIRGERYTATTAPADRQDWFLFFRPSQAACLVADGCDPGRWNAFAHVKNASDLEATTITEVLLPELFQETEESDNQGGRIRFSVYDFKATPAAAVRENPVDATLILRDITKWRRDWPELTTELDKLLADLCGTAPAPIPEGNAARIPEASPTVAGGDRHAQPQDADHGQNGGGDGIKAEYRELAQWVRDDLKGKQRRAVELLIEHNGRIAISDLATDPAINWEAPFDNAFNSLRRELKEKLSKSKLGWRISRQSNEARLNRRTVAKVVQE